MEIAKQMMSRALLVAAAAIAAAIAIVTVLPATPASAQSDDETTGRIVARLLDDGRVEFGWQSADGVRVLPRQRYFPTNARVDRWLRSSPVEVGGAEIGRINARLLDDGRIEFAFTPTGGERILTHARYFPTDARVGRWLRSTEITLTPPAAGYTAISAGGDHTCAIRESGEIACWGSNTTEQFNPETSEFEEVHTGQATPPVGTFTAVSAGKRHTCGLRPNGKIECWGDVTDIKDDPLTGSFTAISAGRHGVCGLRENGEIACSDRRFSDLSALLGLPDFLSGTQQDAPAGHFSAVSAGGGGVSIYSTIDAAYIWHACAIRESGEITCWGANEGVSINTETHWPEAVYVGQVTPPEGKFTAVSAGGWHTCAIRTSGEIACWGSISSAPPGRFAAVSAGAGNTCGLRENGAIECWGADSSKHAGRYTAVSVGGSHACALLDTGAIRCWGANNDGQATPPTD